MELELFSSDGPPGWLLKIITLNMERIRHELGQCGVIEMIYESGGRPVCQVKANENNSVTCKAKDMTIREK